MNVHTLTKSDKQPIQGAKMSPLGGIITAHHVTKNDPRRIKTLSKLFISELDYTGDEFQVSYFNYDRTEVQNNIEINAVVKRYAWSSTVSRLLTCRKLVPVSFGIYADLGLVHMKD